MKRSLHIQIKAIFLLIIFCMNMIVGFACSMGLCVFCNTIPEEKTAIMAPRGCCHKQPTPVKSHKSKSCTNNCCNENIVKLAQVDKAFPECFAGVNFTCFAALISSHYNIDVSGICKAQVNIKYFVRSHHPPIPDIRIAIQSFQI